MNGREAKSVKISNELWYTSSTNNGFCQSSHSRHLCLASSNSASINFSTVCVLMRLLSRFCNYLLLSQSQLLRWMLCLAHQDEMFLLNDALQPFQVSQGQAGHNISWFHYANRPLLLHSRQCVYVCVITHAWAPVTPPPPNQYLPSILITPFLAFTGLTEFVHVSPTPVCNLLPHYTTWQIDECTCDSLVASNRHRNTRMVAHRHT